MDKIYHNASGKIVGVLSNGVYYTERDSKKHYYIKGRGYPISVAILNDLEVLNCQKIYISENTTKATQLWKAELKQYQEKLPFKEHDFDEQKCCPLSEMELVKRTMTVVKNDSAN